MTNAPILIEYKFRTGDTLKYKSTMETKQETNQYGQAQETQSSLEMDIKQSVADIKDDIFKMEILIERGSLTQNNVTQELPPVEKTSFTSFKKNGEIVAQEEAQFSQQAFPTHPINIGESWINSVNLKFPGRTEPVTINYNYTFEKIENFKSLECAYIKVKCPVSKTELQPNVTQEFQAEGFVYFAYNEGFLVKSNLKTISKLTSAQIQMSAENDMGMELKEINGKNILNA